MLESLPITTVVSIYLPSRCWSPCLSQWLCLYSFLLDVGVLVYHSGLPSRCWSPCLSQWLCLYSFLLVLESLPITMVVSIYLPSRCWSPCLSQWLCLFTFLLDDGVLTSHSLSQWSGSVSRPISSILWPFHQTINPGSQWWLFPVRVTTMLSWGGASSDKWSTRCLVLFQAVTGTLSRKWTLVGRERGSFQDPPSRIRFPETSQRDERNITAAREDIVCWAASVQTTTFSGARRESAWNPWRH